MTQSTQPASSDMATGAGKVFQGKALSAWRRQRREQLLRQRLEAGGRQRRVWNEAIMPVLRSLLPDARGTVYGLYWPFKGEFAIRGLMWQLHEQGGCLALPHVARAKQPLQFLRWHPDVEMVRGVYDIPVPKDTAEVIPDVLVVPLVGFDSSGYRLGYGGGYDDRTIASMRSRPLLIGVGYELSRLTTIYPQPHDIPMDYVVTEAGCRGCR